ncbi:MAG: type II secretion system major pseudopilin GspG [Betaproteobacteria bacterium]|nr:type II secretion system major pseudopilin GspG [Betaproteobacteria bacterium]MBK9705024.1 type II secretion system major pseudopilin GspG [Betaproteobacteria bacterium]
MTKRINAPRGSRGFSLLELLVVLLLLGAFAGIFAPKIFGQAEKAKQKAAKLEIDQIGQALDLYKLEIGRYPTSQEGLAALMTAPSGASNWNGPYLKRNAVPKDPWSNEYRYVSPGDQNRPYDIISLGSDGKEGGDGDGKDINSWQ